MSTPAIDVAAAERQAEAAVHKLEALRREIGRVIIGQRQVVDELLITLLAGGHALLEGVPGVAKTLLVRTLSDALDLSFRRIQFTPDLMPSDVVGTEVLEEDHGTGRRVFTFQRGPVFTHLLLADEINRAPPKTQAALLEAMQERAVTYGGTTYDLPRPFMVLATQNPIEQGGTYPLPEAQLDRFLLYIRVPYPDASEEVEIYTRTTGRDEGVASEVMTGADVVAMQALTRDVHLSSTVAEYAARLIRASRPDEAAGSFVREHVRWGAGPRAGQALILAGKARALLQGRFSTTPDDVRAVAPAVLRHRLLPSFSAEADGITSDDIAARLLSDTDVPASPLR